MKRLTSEELESFVTAKPAAAIHFDAEWNVTYRPILRARMLEAEKVLGERASFGEIEIDRDQELARLMRITNVPAVAYYREGRLIAALIGVRQNVHARVERVLRGEPIGPKDGTNESV